MYTCGSVTAPVYYEDERLNWGTVSVLIFLSAMYTYLRDVGKLEGCCVYTDNLGGTLLTTLGSKAMPFGRFLAFLVFLLCS